VGTGQRKIHPTVVGPGEQGLIDIDRSPLETVGRGREEQPPRAVRWLICSPDGVCGLSLQPVHPLPQGERVMLAQVRRFYSPWSGKPALSQAIIPPSRSHTFVKPRRVRLSAAMALMRPLRQ